MVIDMSLSRDLVKTAFELDQQQIEKIKQCWMTLMEIIVWYDVASTKIGALPRARKRVLEVGESFRSFIASKDWIDQPRQQLKSALGASVKLRDSLTALNTVCAQITEGEDVPRFQSIVSALDEMIMNFILPLENQWAELLDSE